ncbi:MAG TPA: inositol monophosphatase family protein [Chloroflexota bacterium]
MTSGQRPSGRPDAPPSSDQERLLEVALAAASAGARQLRRPASRQALKGGDPINVVTDRDLASQRAIFRVIRRAFPDHRLIGEEELPEGDGAPTPSPQHPEPSVWTVDPLDGTSNFSHGQAPYGVSVGCAAVGGPLVGVIAAPTLPALAWAVRGRGAFLRQRGRVRRLGVSDRATLDRALVLTGYGYERSGYPAWLARFQRVLVAAQAVRMTGSAVNDLISVAGGAADVYWEDELQPWDWAAGALLVEEAGGRVSQLDGRPLSSRRSTFLATNGLLHAELLRFLSS